MKSCRGRGHKDRLILGLGTRWRWVVTLIPQPIAERAPGTNEQEAWWAPGLVWNILDKISCPCRDSNPKSSSP